MQGRLRRSLAFVKQVSYDSVVLQRDYPDQVCSIARSLEVIGERWTLLILRDAVVGLTRFEEFQAKLGIASNVLTNRLKRLCDEELLERVPDPERICYSSTAAAAFLEPATAAKRWSGSYPRACGGAHALATQYVSSIEWSS